MAVSKRKPDEFCNKEVKNVNKDEQFCKSNESFKYNLVDVGLYGLTIIIFSTSIATVHLVVIEHILNTKELWGLYTLLLALIPSCLIQLLSLKLNDYTQHIKLHWSYHILQLAVIYRFFLLILMTLKMIKQKNYQNKCCFFKLKTDSFILNLFSTFFIMIPQIIFQSYIITNQQKINFGNGAIIFMAILSIIWALSMYSSFVSKSNSTFTQFTWLSVMVYCFWRGGMLASRIAALVLAALCFGSWIIIIFGIHTLGMTLWIAQQKTECCNSPLEEYAYKTMIGALYFFDFFRLLENQLSLHTCIYYTMISIQNITYYGAFLLIFSHAFQMNVFIISSVMILGGTFIGCINMMIYLTMTSWTISIPEKSTNIQLVSTVDNVNKMNPGGEENSNLNLYPVKETITDKKSLLDNIVQNSDIYLEEGIINTSFLENDESNVMVQVVIEDSKPDSRIQMSSLEEINQDGIHIEKVEHEEQICLEDIKPKSPIIAIDYEQSTLQKRRGICSLTQLGINSVPDDDNYETKNFPPDSSIKPDQNTSLNVDSKSVESSFIDSLPIKNLINENDVLTKNLMLRERFDSPLLEKDDEKSSENSQKDEIMSHVMSVHDYENLCPLGVARPPWCIRSWQGYTDIETYVHDDSVIRDRRRDTLTSTATGTTISSDCSEATYATLNGKKVRSRQDDYLDTLAYDLADWDSNRSVSDEMSTVSLQHNDEREHTCSIKSSLINERDAVHPLHTILEEREDRLSSSDLRLSSNPSMCSVSSLVATIDEIRKCTVENSPRHIYHRTESQCEDMEGTLKKRLPNAKLSFSNDARSLNCAKNWNSSFKYIKNEKLNIIKEMTNYCLKDSNGKTPLINAILSDSPILGPKADSQACDQVDLMQDNVYVEMNSFGVQKFASDAKSDGSLIKEVPSNDYSLTKIDEENILNTTVENVRMLGSCKGKTCTENITEVKYKSGIESKLSPQKNNLKNEFEKISDSKIVSAIINDNHDPKDLHFDRKRKNINRPRRKFSLLRERFEPKSDQIYCVVAPQSKLISNRPQLNSLNKKMSVIFNDPDTLNSTVTYDKENSSNSTLRKTNLNTLESKNIFFRQVLSPPKFQSWTKKRIFSPNSKFSQKKS